jgi:hypothetical protein
LVNLNTIGQQDEPFNLSWSDQLCLQVKTPSKKSSTGSDFRTGDASRVPLPKRLVAVSINQVVEQGGAFVRRKNFAGTLAFAKGMNI